MATEAGDVEGDMVNWVQCEKGEAWRLLPDDVDFADLFLPR